MEHGQESEAHTASVQTDLQLRVGPHEERDESIVSSQVLEYYSKYSQSKQLPKYFCGDPTPYMRPPLIGQDQSNLKDDLKLSHDEMLVDPDIHRASSPTSSVASKSRLEWDNGADIGYENCDSMQNKQRSVSLPALTSLEKIELRKNALRLSPEGVTNERDLKSMNVTSFKCSAVNVAVSSSEEDGVKEDGGSHDMLGVDKKEFMKMLKKTVGYPNAESTPIASTSGNHLKRSPETLNAKETPVTSNIRGYSKENSKSKTPKTVTLSSSCEYISGHSPKVETDMKKSRSNNELRQTETEKQKQKIAKLEISRAITVECSGTVLKSSSKYIQTSLQRQISRSVQTDFANNETSDTKDKHRKHSSPVPESRNRQSVIYLQHSSDGNVTSSTSTQTDCSEENSVSKCNSFEYLYGDEYDENSQKHIVPPLNLPHSSPSEDLSPNPACKESNFTSTSTSCGSKAVITSSNSSSDCGLGALLEVQLSKRLITDVEKSLELMQKLLQSSKYDSATKKHFIKKLVRKIVNSNYVDDSTTDVETTPSDARLLKTTTTTTESSSKAETENAPEEKIEAVVDEEVLQKSLHNNKPWIPPAMESFKRPSAAKLQKPPRKFQVKTFCNEIVPPAVESNHNSDALVPTLTKTKSEIVDRMKVGDVSYVPTKIVYERRLKNSKFTLTNNFFGNEFECDERGQVGCHSSTEHSTSNELYDLPKKFSLPPKRSHAEAAATSATTDESTSHDKVVKSWRDFKTKSEKMFETKKYYNKADGDQILIYAKKERENQLSWIRNEITHLSKLKNLLENKNSARHKALVKTLASMHFEDFPEREATEVYMMASQQQTGTVPKNSSAMRASSTDSDVNTGAQSQHNANCRCCRCKKRVIVSSGSKRNVGALLNSGKVNFFGVRDFSENQRKPVFSGKVNFCDAVKLNAITVQLNADSQETSDKDATPSGRSSQERCKCICRPSESIKSSTQCVSQVASSTSKNMQFEPKCYCGKKTQSSLQCASRNAQNASEYTSQKTQFKPDGCCNKYCPYTSAPSIFKEAQYCTSQGIYVSRKCQCEQFEISLNTQGRKPDKSPSSSGKTSKLKFNEESIAASKSELQLDAIPSDFDRTRRRHGTSLESGLSFSNVEMKKNTYQDNEDLSSTAREYMSDFDTIPDVSGLNVAGGDLDKLYEAKKIDSNDIEIQSTVIITNEAIDGKQKGPEQQTSKEAGIQLKPSDSRQGSKDFGQATERRSSKDTGVHPIKELSSSRESQTGRKLSMDFAHQYGSKYMPHFDTIPDVTGLNLAGADLDKLYEAKKIDSNDIEIQSTVISTNEAIDGKQKGPEQQSSKEAGIQLKPADSRHGSKEFGQVTERRSSKDTGVHPIKELSSSRESQTGRKLSMDFAHQYGSKYMPHFDTIPDVTGLNLAGADLDKFYEAKRIDSKDVGIQSTSPITTSEAIDGKHKGPEQQSSKEAGIQLKPADLRQGSKDFGQVTERRSSKDTGVHPIKELSSSRESQTGRKLSMDFAHQYTRKCMSDFDTIPTVTGLNLVGADLGKLYEAKRIDSKDIGIQSTAIFTSDAIDEKQKGLEQQSSKEAGIQLKPADLRQGSKDFGQATERRSSKDTGVHPMKELSSSRESQTGRKLTMDFAHQYSREMKTRGTETQLRELSPESSLVDRSMFERRNCIDYGNFDIAGALKLSVDGSENASLAKVSDANMPRRKSKDVESNTINLKQQGTETDLMDHKSLQKEVDPNERQARVGLERNSSKDAESGAIEVKEQGTKINFRNNKTSETDQRKSAKSSRGNISKHSHSSTSKSSDFSSSSGQVYDLKDVISLLCKCCKKPLKETPKPPVLRVIQDEDDECEENFILCHPCYRGHQSSNWQQNYKLPGHVCNCYAGVQQKMCSCANGKFWVKTNSMMCSTCMCARKKPKKKSLAYMLTFEDGFRERDDSDAEFRIPKELEEVKVKIPFRPNKKRNKNIENTKRATKDRGKQRSSDEEEDVDVDWNSGDSESKENFERNRRNSEYRRNGGKTKKTPSLQEALMKNYPNFVDSAECRRKCLLELAIMREKQKGDKCKLLLAALSGQNPISSDQQKISNINRLFTSKAMKDMTKKNYKKLPEVQKRLLDHREKQQKKANRMLADIFNKKLQRKALRGSINISPSINLLDSVV